MIKVWFLFESTLFLCDLTFIKLEMQSVNYQFLRFRCFDEKYQMIWQQTLNFWICCYFFLFLLPLCKIWLELFAKLSEIQRFYKTFFSLSAVFSSFFYFIPPLFYLLPCKTLCFVSDNDRFSSKHWFFIYSFWELVLHETLGFRISKMVKILEN